MTDSEIKVEQRHRDEASTFAVGELFVGRDKGGLFSLLRPGEFLDALAAKFAEIERDGTRRALEMAAECVEAERAKLNGRWSLDSAYLAQAINAIRALAPAATTEEP